MVWTAKKTHCRPMSKCMLSDHQCSLSRWLFHVWSIVQSHLQNNRRVHWASLRSLATMNINVVKLSLNGKRLSWMITNVEVPIVLSLLCVWTHNISIIIDTILILLSNVSKILVLSSLSLMVDSGNMSIQVSLKRFKNKTCRST